MDQWSSLNRFLMRSWWGTVGAMYIFPIHPALVRAVGSSGSDDLLGEPVPSETDYRLLGGSG